MDRQYEKIEARELKTLDRLRSFRLLALTPTHSSMVPRLL